MGKFEAISCQHPGPREAIYHDLEVTNQHPKTFVWSKNPDEILATIARFCNRTSGTPQ